MLITISRRTAICQSVAEVWLTSSLKALLNTERWVDSSLKQDLICFKCLVLDFETCSGTEISEKDPWLKFYPDGLGFRNYIP